MLFKQYLNIATVIAAGTTCCTTVAMDPRAMIPWTMLAMDDPMVKQLGLPYNMTPDELQTLHHSTLEYFDASKITEQILKDRTGYTNSGFLQKQSSFPELTQVMDVFKNSAPTKTLNRVEKKTLVKTVQPSSQSKHPRQNVVPVFPTVPSSSAGITKKSQKNKKSFKQTATWNNALTTGEQIPKDIRALLMAEYQYRYKKSPQCSPGTRLTALFQHLLTRKSITELTASLKDETTGGPLKKYHMNRLLYTIKQNPTLMTILNDLVKKSKDSANYI
jgi:hypothetical protein